MTVNLGGIIVPTVTAMTSKGEINEKGVREIVNYQIEQGADALIPTASNGEFPHLSHEERIRVWEIFLEEANGRVPIIPNATALTTNEALIFSKQAESLGASGILLAPPFYYYLTESELFLHYRTIAESISIPVVVYNEPSLFKVDLTPNFMKELSKIDNILYMKESSFDSRRIHEIIRFTEGKITLFAGACDLAFEGLLLGARGWVTGILNFFISVPKSFYGKISIGDFEGAKILYYQKILPLATLAKQSPQGVPFMKTALEILGLPAGPPRYPLMPMSDDEKSSLRLHLMALDIN